MPTTNSASIRTYLAAYGISKPLLHNWAPRRYRVLNGESGQEDGLVHGSTDIASMYHELDSLLEFSSPIDDPESVQSPAPSADNPYLYLLQNPRGQWGKFRIIEVDSSSMPLQVVSIETLKEAYNATRGPWSKLLYGEPIATGLLKVSSHESKKANGIY